MSKSRVFFLIAVSMSMLQACSSTPPEPVATDAVLDSTPPPVAVESDKTAGAQADTAVASDPLESGLLAERIIYFDFDSAQVKAEYNAIIEAHAQFLAQHPQATVALEGHADERGTRDYNLALGESRAMAVKQYFILMGAKADQIKTVSFGEEKPLVTGQGESVWSRNRRVEVVYK